MFGHKWKVPIIFQFYEMELHSTLFSGIRYWSLNNRKWHCSCYVPNFYVVNGIKSTTRSTVILT